MPSQTDLEITRACAQMMGIRLVWNGHPDQFVPMFYEGKTYRLYAPLDDAAQNAALDEVLLKYGHYRMSRYELHYVYGDDRLKTFTPEADMTVAANRRRARCLCVYKIWESLR